MTRTVLVLLASCVALVVAAMASILDREIVPAAPFKARPMNAAALVGPSPNTDGKRDKLPVIGKLAPEATDGLAGEPLRQTYDPDSPPVEPGPVLTGPVPMPRARGASRPAIQKNYTLLSDVQIAAIRGRLRLTAAQEPYWPGVENALRAIARTMHDKRQGNPAAGAPAIDAASMEVEDLKTAAMPLLAQLREDQKREVRQLARLIGLEAIASQI